MSGNTDNSGDGTLGRIALKQVRVSRQELAARQAAQSESSPGAAPAAGADARRKSKGANPMNRLVPYLDLFCRLEDEELSRLARVPTSVVVSLRKQVDDISDALDQYADLLPRLRDDELQRLTGASAKTVQFWRLCQPRAEPTVKRQRPPGTDAEDSGVRAQVSEGAPAPSDSVVGAVDELGAQDSGVGLSPAEDSGLHALATGEHTAKPKSPVAAADNDEVDAALDGLTEA